MLALQPEKEQLLFSLTLVHSKATTCDKESTSFFSHERIRFNGGVSHSNPVHFMSNLVNIFSQSVSCPLCLC